MSPVREAMLNTDLCDEVSEIRVEKVQYDGHDSLIYSNIVVYYANFEKQIIMRTIPHATAETLAQGLREALEEVKQDEQI